MGFMRERVVEHFFGGKLQKYSFFCLGVDDDAFFKSNLFRGGATMVGFLVGCKMWQICHGGKDYLDEQEQQACGSLLATFAECCLIP